MRVLALLLTVCSAWCQPVIVGNFVTGSWGGAAAAAPAGCASTDTTNAWDNFLEGFETATTGYTSNWTEFGTTANIAEAFDSTALSTYKPPGACNQCWHIVLPEDGTETYARHDLGAALPMDTVPTTATLCVYISAITLANVAYYSLADFGNGTTPGINTLRLYNNNSQYELYVASESVSDKVPIVMDQWYTCVISWDTAAEAAGSTFKVFANDAQVGSTRTFKRWALNYRYLWVGSNLGLDASEGGTFNIDLLSIKTQD